jgi:hypothetical protein
MRVVRMFEPQDHLARFCYQPEVIQKGNMLLKTPKPAGTVQGRTYKN